MPVNTLVTAASPLQKIDSEDYDLIICDLRMPKVDGSQIYQFVQRHRPEFVNRLIFSSGDTVSVENHRFLEMTGCHFLAKPFLLKELQQVISKALVEAVA